MASFRSLSAENRRLIYEQNLASHPGSMAVIVEAHPQSKLMLTRYCKYARHTQVHGQCGLQRAHPYREPQEAHRQPAAPAPQGSRPLHLPLLRQQTALRRRQYPPPNPELADLQKYRNPEDNFLYLTVAETPTF
jgi:hypothetical protein